MVFWREVFLGDLGVSLNPLNQVYVFNPQAKGPVAQLFGEERLNPLNQVYVFNDYILFENPDNRYSGLNPLNQVYVFNGQ